MLRQYELVERVKSYDPEADEDLLNRAYVFSMKAHGSQLRASGDPYFSHPIEVAGILTELQKVRIDDDDVADEIGNLAASAEALRLTAAAPRATRTWGRTTSEGHRLMRQSFRLRPVQGMRPRAT